MTKKEATRLSIELSDLLQITDFDEFQTAINKSVVKELTPIERKKVEIVSVLQELYKKLFFKKYPTFESYHASTKGKIYIDFAGRQQSCYDKEFNQRYYNYMRKSHCK